MVPTDEDATTLDPEHASALLYPEAQQLFSERMLSD